MVALEPNAEHRRSPLVRLTELGKRKFATVDRRQVAWVNKLASGLDRSDLETAARVLETLCTRLEATQPGTSKGWADAASRTG